MSLEKKTACVLILCGFAYAMEARAEVYAYDEYDGRAGGTIGWAEDWAGLTRSGGELQQTVGYFRRHFSAPLGGENQVVWIAVSGRMSATIPTYSYHVPMGTTSWTNAYQHPGLHFASGRNVGLIDNQDTVTTGVSATTEQTWLARYEFSPALPSGRFNILVSVWIGAEAGTPIDVSVPPRYTALLQDATLDSFYAGQSSPGTHFSWTARAPPARPKKRSACAATCRSSLTKTTTSSS